MVCNLQDDAAGGRAGPLAALTQGGAHVILSWAGPQVDASGSDEQSALVGQTGRQSTSCLVQRPMLSADRMPKPGVNQALANEAGRSNHWLVAKVDCWHLDSSRSSYRMPWSTGLRHPKSSRPGASSLQLRKDAHWSAFGVPLACLGGKHRLRHLAWRNLCRQLRAPKALEEVPAD